MICHNFPMKKIRQASLKLFNKVSQIWLHIHIFCNMAMESFTMKCSIDANKEISFNIRWGPHFPPRYYLMIQLFSSNSYLATMSLHLSSNSTTTISLSIKLFKHFNTTLSRTWLAALRIKCHAHNLWWALKNTLLMEFFIATSPSVIIEEGDLPFMASRNCSNKEPNNSTIPAIELICYFQIRKTQSRNIFNVHWMHLKHPNINHGSIIIKSFS